jgi:hemoglobin-like flavoprotein
MGNQAFGCVSSLPETPGGLYPSYVASDDELDVTPETMKTLTGSMDMITSGRSEGYKAHRAKGNETDTALVYFYNCFFENVYNRMPVAKEKFQGNMNKQGQMLAAILKFLVKAIGHEPEFTTSLQYLAMLHNALGITTQMYSLMGIILVDTVAKCLGSEFTDEIRHAWITTYSAMMNVMIPIVEAGTRVTDNWMQKNGHNLLPEYRADDDDSGSRSPKKSNSKSGSRGLDGNRSKKGSKSDTGGDSKKPSVTNTPEAKGKRRSKLNVEGARGVVPRFAASPVSNSHSQHSQPSISQDGTPDLSGFRLEDGSDEHMYERSRSRSYHSRASGARGVADENDEKDEHLV